MSSGSLPEVLRGEGTLARPDVEIYMRWDRPPRPIASVLFVHGVLEHCGRYSSLAAALREADVSYFAFDHRGHGRSRPAHAFTGRFSDFVEDLQAVCTRVCKVEPGAPLFIVGHSMGSLITAHHAAGREGLAGIVLAAPPTDPTLAPPAFVVDVARRVARWFPRLRIHAGLDPGRLSHNEQVIQATRSDPLMQRRMPLALALQLLEAAAALPTLAASIRTPTLILQGDEDPVSREGSAERLREWIGAADKELFVLAGMRHELFLEVEPLRRKVFDLLIAWIRRHASG